VQHGSESPRNFAENAAVEEASFAIVLNRTFKSRDVEISDGIIFVVGVADFPGAIAEEIRHSQELGKVEQVSS